MNDVRGLLEERIEEIKKVSNGFSTGLMRWENALFNNVKFKDVRLNHLTDEELVEFFERLMIRYYKQM